MKRAERQTDTEATDVIVVGAGVAGLCAALGAAEAGLQAVLIEKQPAIGGSTALSGGFMAFAGTALQTREGVQDDADLLFRDLFDLSGGLADPQLLRTYCAGQLDLYRWLVAQGVVFTSVESSSGQAVPRSHKTDARSMLAALQGRCLASGRVRLRTGARASRLVRDAAGGRVRGVRLEGRDAPIMARRAVILATGGFSRSRALLDIFAPQLAGAMLHGGQGSTGDGLSMAWLLGAGMRDMGQVKATFGTHPDTGPDRHEIVLACYLGAIIVNRAGRRFVDESKSYKTLGDACLRQQGQAAFQIFDAKVMRKSKPGVDTYDLSLPAERGLLIRADTLEQLADRIGIAPEDLAGTVAHYNEAVRCGHDADFGRDGLLQHAGAMIGIDQAPYYAYPSTGFVSSTYCGLSIDAQARVLDACGSPIEGLFAAGELTGGFHGEAYMTGSSLGKAAFFGRLAGAGAARAEPDAGMQGKGDAS